MSKKSGIAVSRCVTDGLLAAIFFVLTFLSLEVGGIKLTFDSLAVVIAAMLYGPVDGLIVGLLGAFLEQLLKYGITATTLLWIIPPALRGLVIGLGVKFLPERMSPTAVFASRKPYIYYAFCFLAAVVTSLGNTLVYYIDSKLYGYYSYQLIFGVLGLRIVTGLISAALTATAALPVLRALAAMKRRAA